MLLLAAALAVTIAPVPSPSPRSALAPLKTIASVRATPYCSALRKNVAPAIAALLDSDASIDASLPIFGQLYRHGVIEQSTTEFDIIHMESLLTPLVKAQRAIDNALADKVIFLKSPKTDDDRKLLEIKDKLQAVQARQKDALNVISGFVATYQMGELQEEGLPASWQGAIGITQSRPGLQDQAPSVASTLLNAGIAPGPEGRPAAENPAYYGPFTDPFAPLRTAILQLRQDGDAKEADASRVILAAVEQCRP